MRDAAGRRSFEAVSGTEKVIAAGTVILALGQEKGLGKWMDALGIKDSADSGYLTDRIYATGDMITGPATVVEAVAGGINSARRIIEEVFS
jgi:NADPH-dependent glutamate synthase beta subunit-like oxidoreductase